MDRWAIERETGIRLSMPPNQWLKIEPRNLEGLRATSERASIESFESKHIYIML